MRRTTMAVPDRSEVGAANLRDPTPPTLQ